MCSLILNLPLDQIIDLNPVPLGDGCHAILAKLHAADDKEAICSRVMGDASGVIAIQHRYMAVGATGTSAGIPRYGTFTTMVFYSCHFSSFLPSPTGRAMLTRISPSAHFVKHLFCSPFYVVFCFSDRFARVRALCITL